jgi:small subunit ribosomal protein S1
MPGRDILRELNIDQEEIERDVQAALHGFDREKLEEKLDSSVQNFTVDTVLEGRVVDVSGDEVMVDIGYKSEGAVSIYEWDDPKSIKVGDKVEVLLEAVEDVSGVVQLSKAKADRVRAWEKVIETHKEGDIVAGRVVRKIKGGLLIDIGVPVFLPASQVDIRRPGEIADYIGHSLTCKILKIDEERQNIVVSRRQLIEEQREVMQRRLFPRLEVGEIRTGKVKNIVDFGAFVDLGGIDGLLHITDMSWGRISHPSEMVAIDDDIEVKILNVDEEDQKVALGLKQKTPSPWQDIEERYPVGTTVSGEVVNLMSYGAFVKLEEGIEGLVHISEMSWTRRINHPSELVSIGDVVDVVVLGIDTEQEQISLGMKQIEKNPWEAVKENYPPGSRVVGKVRNLTSYGAFVEIEDGIDGLLHVNDMSWTEKVNHPSQVVNKGDTIETVVLEVNPEKRRVALGLKQLEPDPWEEEIPSKYRAGDIVRGRISKLTNFGAFVELEDGLEGLLHISEMSEKDIDAPEDIVAEGDVVDVRVLRVDQDERKIGLSLLPAAGKAIEGEGPQLVMFSDEIEEAEEPQQLVREILEDAPQNQEREETDEESEDGEDDSARNKGGLNIPADVVSDDKEDAAEDETEETDEDVSETSADVEEENSDERTV